MHIEVINITKLCFGFIIYELLLNTNSSCAKDGGLDVKCLDSMNKMVLIERIIHGITNYFSFWAQKALPVHFWMAYITWNGWIFNGAFRQVPVEMCISIAVTGN